MLKKIILVFVVFGLIVLLDHSSTFLLYFQLLFTQKKKKNQNISQSGYVPHMSSKFCLNSASTFLCNEQTNKKQKQKQKKTTKEDKNDENEIQVSGGLLMASGISD